MKTISKFKNLMKVDTKISEYYFLESKCRR